MLVAVIMIFVTFTLTGVAVLDLSAVSSMASQETVNNIKLQYAVESSINEALWRINSDVDSLVNTSTDGVICEWDSSTQTLSVDIDRFDMESEIQLDLSQDTHFQRGLASDSPINTYGYSTGVDEDHRLRLFSFMPAVDLHYFLDNALKVHNANQASWKGDEVSGEGIHIFTGNNIEIDSIFLNNSTLVFTGKGITFTGNNTIRAAIPFDSTVALPAIVFTDPETVFTLVAGNRIEGAIYCAGQINLENAVLTGPVVAKTIFLNDDLNLLDGEYAEYYRWALGFGAQNDYDWPKQIQRWKVNKWIRKNLNA